MKKMKKIIKKTSKQTNTKWRIIPLIYQQILIRIHKETVGQASRRTRYFFDDLNARGLPLLPVHGPEVSSVKISPGSLLFIAF